MVRWVDDCYSCEHNAAIDRPPREEVVLTGHWRVVHNFDTALPGWLVLVPLEHVLAFHDLPEQAMTELGDLVGRLSRALREVTGCAKTYLMQFSEAPGFSHLHVHLVPRMPDQPEDRKGPAVFGYLAPDEPDLVPDHEMDRIAVAVAQAVGS